MNSPDPNRVITQSNPGYGNPTAAPNVPPPGIGNIESRGKILTSVSKYLAKMAIGTGAQYLHSPELPQAIEQTTGEDLSHTIGEAGDEIRFTSKIAFNGVARFVTETRHNRAATKAKKLQKSSAVFKEAVDALVEGRYPDADLRPVSNLQQRQALRASRRRWKNAARIHSERRLQYVYGDDIGDESAIKTANQAGRYRLGERWAMGRAAHRSHQIDKKVGPDNPFETTMQRIAKSPKLARSSAGNDIPGKFINVRSRSQEKKAASAQRLAHHLAAQQEENRRIREVNRAARKARKQQTK